MKISKKAAKGVKRPDEAVEAVNNMEKIIISNKYYMLWSAYQ